jgi:hypothetical protein
VKRGIYYVGSIFHLRKVNQILLECPPSSVHFVRQKSGKTVDEIVEEIFEGEGN